MENRYLEKISGFGGTLGKIVGKYAKNLTGETVRETQRAANLHKSMDAAAHSSETMNKSFKDTMSRNGPKKNMGEFFLNREAKVQAKKSGMDQMRNAATKEVPHTTQAHVDSAIAARDATRKGTALATGVAAGSMYSGARRRAQNEEYQYKYASAHNRYLEKIASSNTKERLKNAGKGAAYSVLGGAVYDGVEAAAKYHKRMPKVPGGYDALENVGKGLEGAVHGLTGRRLVRAAIVGATLGALRFHRKENVK